MHRVLPILCITFKRSENYRKYIVCVAPRRSPRGPPRRGVLPLRGTLLSVPFPTAPHQIRHIVSSASYPYCNNLILPVPYCIISYCINPPLHNSLFVLPAFSAQSPTATIFYCITSCQQLPNGPFCRYEEEPEKIPQNIFRTRERPFAALYGAFPPETNIFRAVRRRRYGITPSPVWFRGLKPTSALSARKVEDFFIIIRYSRPGGSSYLNHSYHRGAAAMILLSVVKNFLTTARAPRGEDFSV